MVSRTLKSSNTLNAFLNEYFNALVAGVLILFLAAAYFLFLGPKFRETQDLIKTNTESQINLYRLSQKKLATLQAIVEIYKKIDPADLQKFNGILPEAYVKERLFGELEEIVASGGWLLKSVNIEAPDPAAAPSVVPPAGGAETVGGAVADKNLGKINLMLSVSAIDYSGFKNLLRLLETNLRLFDVTQINLSPSGSSADLTLTTYYYKSAP